MMHLTTDRASSIAAPVSRRPRHDRAFAALWLLPILLLLLPLSAAAQFNGPPASIDSQVNRPVTPTTDPAVLYPGPRDVKLDRGDLLAIHLYGGVNDYSPSVRVALDGTIRLPLIGLVQVGGLTIHEAESLITTKLIAAGMYVDPQVTIQLSESPNNIATVTGEMHGVIPILGSQRLLDVLSAAGQMPPTASHIITINRVGLDQPIVIDLGNDPAHSDHADVPIFAHDTIVVARVGVVYVLGAFKTSGAIPLQKNSPLTLLQAVSLSGGNLHEGKFKDLRIIRTTGNSRSVVRVDFKKILDGHLPDPVLLPDDVIFLPTDAWKVATTAAGIGTILGIASILLYTFHP